MKFLLLLLLLLPASLYAEQVSWVTVKPDHLDSTYSAGERAAFQISVNNLPTDPAYGVYVTVQKASEETPSAVELNEGVGAYISGPLAAGSTSFEVVTHFTGPASGSDPAFDQIVQDDVFQLQVNQ